LEYSDNILGGVLGLILFGLIIYSNITLRSKHDEDVRIVWYFFSLTLVVSHMIALWATSNGAIDNNGSFQGEAGEFISKLISASLDINLSFMVLGSVLVIIILPQFLSYLFSGIFGVATKPMLLNESLSFLMWGIIKTFVVTSGISSTIVIFGYFFSWESFEFNEVIGWVLISIGFNSFAFFTLSIFRESEKVLEDITKWCPDKVLNILKDIHEKCTRHIKAN